MKFFNAVLVLCLLTATSISACHADQKAEPLNDLDFAQVTSNTVVFSAPDASSSPLAKVAAGSPLVLVSRIPKGEWISVIDYATGHQGWVLRKRIALYLSLRPRKLIDIPSSHGKDGAAPLVTIQNELSHLSTGQKSDCL